MTIYGFHKLTSTLKSMEGISSDERYFEGLLTVQMKDKQGEVTIVDELYKVLPVWIDRGAPISDTHSNRIVGKGINYSRTTVKNGDGAILPAIKITGKIFKNYELDNVIWNKIKNNEYKGLSFGGATRSARSPIKMKDGTTAYALSDLEHYEVAVCADPAVPMAIITDFNQIAKANFNSSVRDDGKMVIQCNKMGCYVNKAGEMAGGGNGGGDLLTTMEGAKPENYKTVEAGRKRGRPIDKTDAFPRIKREFIDDAEDKESKNWKDEWEDKLFKKFMEKKEMLEATLNNNKEKRPTQPERDMRETETSGYKPDLEKSIEIINKPAYRVDTEDRNNGTEINDLKREIPEKKLPLKGSESQELPRGIQQANLNESQTFEQKVQALIAEGKSRESAEKIVGSFVHKVEASSGSGGAGIGGANLSNGGTITTGTGGTNNPVHNNGCDCTCKDCERNDKCDCCEKCKRKSRGLDISNTNAGGVHTSEYNQDPSNAGRLNNKAGYVNKDSLIKIEDEKDENTTVEVLDEWKHEKHPDAKEKADDGDEDISEGSEVELTEGGEEVFTEAERYANSVNHFKSANIIEVNKVHALLKLNLIKENTFQEQSTEARYRDRKHLKDVPTSEGIKLREAARLSDDGYSTPPIERKDRRNIMGGRTGYAGSMPKQTGRRGAPKVDSRMRKKDPIKTLPLQIKQSLSVLRKLSTFKAPPEKFRKRITVEDIQANNTKERAAALKRVREQGLGAKTASNDLLKQDPMASFKRKPKVFTPRKRTFLSGTLNNPSLTRHRNDSSNMQRRERRGREQFEADSVVLNRKPVPTVEIPRKHTEPTTKKPKAKKIPEVEPKGYKNPSKYLKDLEEVTTRGEEIPDDPVKKLKKALAELKKIKPTRNTPSSPTRNQEPLGSTVGDNDNTISSGIDLGTEDENEAEHNFDDTQERQRGLYPSPILTYHKPTTSERRVREKLEKSLSELKKLQVSGGLGSRGLGSGATYTQGQQETTQVTIVPERPEDDRVSSKNTPKRTTLTPKETSSSISKIRRNSAAFGSDVGGTGGDGTTAVADENTRYVDHNGTSWKTEAERDAVPPRKHMNRRLARDRRNAYRADNRQTIGQRTNQPKKQQL